MGRGSMSTSPPQGILGNFEVTPQPRDALRASVRVLTIAAVVLAVAFAFASRADAASGVRFGIQDDAWLAYGPGTVESRIGTLDKLGVHLVRYTIFWNEVAPTKPQQPRAAADPAYQWGASDLVLKALHAHGIAAVVDIRFAPGWANGGNKPNWLPENATDYADFVVAVHGRFPWVRDWLIWNEPNKAPFMHPVDPSLYVKRLLNPAYAALHAADKSVRVAGGVTGPRAGANGMSPIAFLRGMRSAGAKLDAYAHNPYPENPRVETPTKGGCHRCASITMATLEKLLVETQRAWPGKRIWLTEYGYQTNPPDKQLGVSYAKQARFIGEAGLRVYRAPRVDMLIQFIVHDDKAPSGWQSGFFTTSGKVKPSFDAFRVPLAVAARKGTSASIWGQVRPRRGVQTYRLEILRGGRWKPLGGTAKTNAQGFFTRKVTVPRGAKVRSYSLRDRAASPPLVVA
jgi:hypothetical protein